MSSPVVTVRWLEHPGVGIEETVSRSRVFRMGYLNVGDVVRVRSEHSYSMAEIIDIPADHQLLNQTEIAASSPTPSPLGPREPSSANPSLLHLDLSQLNMYDDGLGPYDSDEDSYDSEDSDDFPVFVSDQESDTALRQQAQRMISNHHSTTDAVPASSDELHVCIDEKLLEDIVRSADVSPDHDEDSTLSAVQRFHAFLSSNIQRIEEELLPRVTSVAEDMLEENRPCLRCLVNLTKTAGRLESLRDNLTVFLGVAERTINTAPEE